MDALIETISKRRLSMKKDLAAIYTGTDSTMFHLRYTLFCLGLDMTGTKEQLVKRIEDHGLEVGGCVIDPSQISMNCCPLYLIKAYLISHSLSPEGTSDELLIRVRHRLGGNGSIFGNNMNRNANKELIREAVEAVNKGEVPSGASICLMGIHGYSYDSFYKTFFDRFTRKRIMGKTGFLEGLWYASFPEMCSHMEFIPTE
jgi:hypothetical protein